MNKTTKAELAFAFSQLHTNHLALVPQSLLEEVFQDVDAETLNKFDQDTPFTEQPLSEETLEILTTIFKDVQF